MSYQEASAAVVNLTSLEGLKKRQNNFNGSGDGYALAPSFYDVYSFKIVSIYSYNIIEPFYL